MVDWKSASRSRLEKARRGHVDRGHRVQVHAYGTGWTLRGEPVEHVGVLMLPRDGVLDDSVWWHEPYDADVTRAALDRCEDVLARLARPGAGPRALPVANDCRVCDWLQPGAADPNAGGCPGAAPDRVPDSLAALVPPAA